MARTWNSLTAAQREEIKEKGRKSRLEKLKRLRQLKRSADLAGDREAKEQERLESKYDDPVEEKKSFSERLGGLHNRGRLFDSEAKRSSSSSSEVKVNDPNTINALIRQLGNKLDAERAARQPNLDDATYRTIKSHTLAQARKYLNYKWTNADRKEFEKRRHITKMSNFIAKKKRKRNGVYPTGPTKYKEIPNKAQLNTLLREYGRGDEAVEQWIQLHANMGRTQEALERPCINLKQLGLNALTTCVYETRMAKKLERETGERIIPEGQKSIKTPNLNCRIIPMLTKKGVQRYRLVSECQYCHRTKSSFLKKDLSGGRISAGGISFYDNNTQHFDDTVMDDINRINH